MATNANECRDMHTCIVAFCTKAGLSIDVDKCHFIATQACNEMKHTEDWTVQPCVNNVRIPRVRITKSFEHLGNTIGIKCSNKFKMFKALKESTLASLDRLIDLKLPPHQKLHDVQMVVLPCWENYLWLNGLMKKHAQNLDKDI
jgi:hypothetical protein